MISKTLRNSGSLPIVDAATATFISTNVSLFSHTRVTSCQHTRYLETKNTWARDDPAILILVAACLTSMTITQRKPGYGILSLS
jgi:hypothetical protein